MSNDHFSFSMPLGDSPSPGADATRYMAPPFDARVADSGHALLLIHGDTQVRRLPLQLVQVLGQCNRLRTIDEHQREAARTLRVAPHQTAAIRQALDELVRQELLQTEADILARLKGPAGESDGIETESIRYLFVRTCARPETLDRLLTSLSRRALPEGLARVIVLDDAADPQSRAETRSVVDRHRKDFTGELALIDPQARRATLERVAREAGANPDRLLWFIEGDPDSHEASYGASLNFALLLGAGRLITLIDDDATLDAFALPHSDQRPAIRRRQSSRLHFPEPNRELPGADYAAVEAHPIALHARLLGTGTNRLIELAGDHLAGDNTTGLLGDLDPQLLSELTGASRVRLTSSGTLGDPGTGGLQWLFSEPPEHLQPLCASEERYRTLIEQRRTARSAGRPEVTTAFALMTTTMTGVDNRDLLLPTQPRGANEDLLFGALVGFVHPDTCQANLPHMLFHMRPEPRRWQRSDLDQPRGVNRGAFLTARIHALRSSLPPGDAESRVRLLAGAFEGLAHGGPDALAWQLRQELLEMRSQMIEQASSVRERLQPPPWLERDFAHVIKRHGQVDEHDEQRLREIAAELPRFLTRYSAALPDWMASWQYCRGAGLDELLENHT